MAKKKELGEVGLMDEKKIAGFMGALQKLTGAVVSHENPHLKIIRTPSPSLNATFGHGWGLPLGFTWVLYGEPKDGKSLIINSTIGQVHQDDPEAIVIKFDTEFREKGQLTEEMMRVYKIDPKRYICFQVNTPAEVFDRITKDIWALVQEGMKLKLVVIDSINGVQGRRRMGAASIEDVTIGDLAQTIQDGMKQILPIQRNSINPFSIICSAQVRSEMDMLEQKRLGNGPKVKMAASWGFKHYAEYVTYIKRNKNADGRKDLFGRDYEAKTGGKDMAGKAEQTMFRLIGKMKDSSLGPIGRTGELTFSIDKGVCNVSHEIFLMGTGRGVIDRKGGTYTFGTHSWTGKEGMVQALEEDAVLAQEVLKELHKRDLAGEWRQQDLNAALETVTEETPQPEED